MPRHLTDAQRIDRLMPLRIARRLLATAWDGRPDQVAAMEEIEAVMVAQLADLPEARAASIRRRTDRIATSLLHPFTDHRFVAVMAAVVIWLNALADEGRLVIDYDAPGYRVLGDLLDEVNKVTDDTSRTGTRDRLYRAALASADHLAPVLAGRARAMGLYRRAA